MIVNSIPHRVFPYDAANVTALELAISAERLHPYIIRAGGSRVNAILLYERNIALSEALYGVIQGIEIALRNVLHRQLSSSPYGAMWFDTAPLGSSQAARVIEAKAKLRWVWPHAWSAGSRVELRILDCSPCQGIRKDAMGSASLQGLSACRKQEPL